MRKTLALLAVLALTVLAWNATARTAAPATGVQWRTQTVTVTTNSSTFTIEPVLDFGRAVTVYLTFTITGVTSDGETFGPNGLHVLWEDTAGFSSAISEDSGVWADGGGGQLYAIGKGGAGSDPAAFQVGDLGRQAYATPRYLRVPITIYSDPGGTVVYAGPNHPTVTVRIDATYLS